MYAPIRCGRLEAPSLWSFAMPRFIDRVGHRYGRLTAVQRVGTSKSKKPLWKCVCDCGNIKIVDSCALASSNTVSCGCYLKEQITKHGACKKSSYHSWRAMIRRCTKDTDKDYPRYGGKGVTVCPRWLEYANFVADMGEPIGDETLDRIDTYGDYELTNCRWAGVKTQNRNVRVRATSKTGVVGVSETKHGTYMAKVTAGKKSFYSKCFKTVEEAAAARKELERIHWGVA